MNDVETAGSLIRQKAMGFPRAVLVGTSLGLLPVLSSAFLFDKFVGSWAVVPGLLLTLGAVIGFFYLVSLGALVRLVPLRRYTVVGLGALWLALGFVYMVVHPLAQQRQSAGLGSDAEQALNMATGELLHGHFPYSAKTYLDNPITPMPGSLVLAAPLMMLFGTSAVQNLVSIGILFAILMLYYRGADALLAACVVVFALPAVVYDLATGVDYLANSVAVLTVVALIDHWQPKTSRGWQVLTAVLAGLAFSSRLSFAPVGAFLPGLVARRTGRTAAVRFMVASGVTFSVVTLPIYLYKPAEFSPLHTYDVLGKFDRFVPHVGVILPALAICLGFAAGWLVLLRKLDVKYACLVCAVLLSVPIVFGLLFSFADRDQWLTFTSFGALTVVFWVVGWRSAIYHSDREA